MALLLLQLGGTQPLLVAVALAGWGLVGFGLVPALQLRVITLAGPGGDLGATLGASAVNAGIAIGAAIGGWQYSAHGLDDVPLAALGLCALALPAALATRLLRPPALGSAPHTVEAETAPTAADGEPGMDRTVTAP
ncbi:hypothetical protein AB0I66_01130 [Streptomyces sp. NPDC050439]|uniref:hypothetical protein n=1 Tax=unclassified Streptomyces TaxID=2593676 RepID=UPI00341B149D